MWVLTSPLLRWKDVVVNRNILFNSKVLHDGLSLCGACCIQGRSRWPFLGSHGGFVLIKMVLVTGRERLWHHPAKEYPLKNKVEKNTTFFWEGGRRGREDNRGEAKKRDVIGKREGQKGRNAREKLETGQSRVRNPKRHCVHFFPQVQRWAL